MQFQIGQHVQIMRTGETGTIAAYVESSYGAEYYRVDNDPQLYSASELQNTEQPMIYIVPSYISRIYNWEQRYEIAKHCAKPIHEMPKTLIEAAYWDYNDCKITTVSSILAWFRDFNDEWLNKIRNLRGARFAIQLPIRFEGRNSVCDSE